MPGKLITEKNRADIYPLSKFLFPPGRSILPIAKTKTNKHIKSIILVYLRGKRLTVDLY